MANAPSTLRIASTGLAASISVVGAELQGLTDAQHRILQWDGDPAIWNGRAPLLFPIVGMLEGGSYRLNGRNHVMAKHGFARHATFEVISHEADAATLRLTANEATREAYPFVFVLDVAYTLDSDRLTMVATIMNDDTCAMPASFGFHPAFRWPLPYGRPRQEHFIRFEHDEPAPIRRIDHDGLLTPQSHPTPVVGRDLTLRDALFDDDAVIFDRLSSRRLTYGAADGPCLDIRFDDFPMLGVWTKPGGAEFICIEPWQGIADPAGFAGDFRDKPGIVAIEPGESRRFAMSVAVIAHR